MKLTIETTKSSHLFMVEKEADEIKEKVFCRGVVIPTGELKPEYGQEIIDLMLWAIK